MLYLLFIEYIKIFSAWCLILLIILIYGVPNFSLKKKKKKTIGMLKINSRPLIGSQSYMSNICAPSYATLMVDAQLGITVLPKLV